MTDATMTAPRRPHTPAAPDIAPEVIVARIAWTLRELGLAGLAEILENEPTLRPIVAVEGHAVLQRRCGRVAADAFGVLARMTYHPAHRARAAIVETVAAAGDADAVRAMARHQ